MKKTFLLLFLLSLSIIPVSANSAMTWWEGSDATGAIIQDEDCPLIITHEQLTFDIIEFPESYYSDIDDYYAYNASVTAAYTIYNPSQYEIQARLLFPFGTIPHYGFTLDYADNLPLMLRDTQRYTITLNEETIDSKIRHTYKPNNEEFSLNEDLNKIKDHFLEHEFFNFNLPITKMTYRITEVDTENYNAAFTAFSIPQSLTKTKVYMPQAHGFDSDKEVMHLGTWVENNMEVIVYVFGEPLDKIEWKYYENGARKKEITGNAELLETTALSFEDFVFAYHNEETPILKHDWYNAIINMIERFSYNDIVIGMEADFNINDDLLRWYDYTITVPEKATVINQVTAPIYPAIDAKYEPPVYEYTYLLSPAKSWKEFKDLTIQINTENYLISSSLNHFEKMENGYTLSLNQLPNSELTFKLSTDPKPVKPLNLNYALMTIAAIMIGYGLPGLLILLLILFFIKSRISK